MVVLGLLLLLSVSGRPQTVAAASKPAGEQSYTEIFQNPTATLSGKSVQTELYFSREDYWDVKKVTLSLNFQISQLAARSTSDITLALNGIKFASFRPAKETGLQTKQIEIPLRLLQGTNTLQVAGQIQTRQGNHYDLAQTPANWLSIYSGANVNFQYNLKPADNSVKSFYAHFTGMDTIANHNSAIVLPQNASDSELQASLYALSGISRVITTTDTKLPLLRAGNSALKNTHYQLFVAKYADLPAAVRKHVAPEAVANTGALQVYTEGQTHYLVLTARRNSLLKKAAQFVANQELMQETATSGESITAQTQTYTSVLQYQGHYQLTSSETQLRGPGHQGVSYFVALPTDRTNADGSQVRLHYRYSKNLNFKRALVSIYVNGTAAGSKRLSVKHANNDELTVKLPRGQSLGNTFNITVDFDLETYDQNSSDNDQTPWANVETDSEAAIVSRSRPQLLFSNFPSTFIRNGSFDKLVVVRPRQMTDADMSTLTNIFNLFGNYAQQNTGSIKVRATQPGANTLRNSSVIAFGTPKQNAFINGLNSKLYFRYNKARTGFVSNEKLSIEKNYGQTIGTDQLLRSPYNDKKALLVVTGATPQATLIGSTQISTQAGVSQFKGDAVVVDPDNQHYSYRFKKQAAVQLHKSARQVISKNSKIIIYLALVFMALGLMLLALFLILRKHKRGTSKGGGNHE